MLKGLSRVAARTKNEKRSTRTCTYPCEAIVVPVYPRASQKGHSAMEMLRSQFSNPAYRFGSATIFLFFAAWGIWWSFYQIWLTSEAGGLQLNGAQVGTVYAIQGAITMVLMLVYGVLQDKLDLKRPLTIFIGASATLIGPFTQFIYHPLLRDHFIVGAILGSVVLSAGFVAGAGLLEAFVERMANRTGFEYGQARMWGSFAYAIVALLAGIFFTINPMLNFWIGSALGALLLCTQLFWHPKGTAQEASIEEVTAKTPPVSEMLGLLKDSHVWKVIVIVLLSWTFYTVFDQQMFPDFYTSLFSSPEVGQRAYGTLNSVQVFLEAIMMGLIPLLMRKVGARNTLLLGIGVMFVRIFLCAAFAGPVLISIAKMLHAFEVPLCILAIFKYFAIHFNKALSATLYLVAFQLSSQLGNVILSTPLGSLRDQIGYQSTFFVISGVVFVAGVIAVFALKPDEAVVNPEEIPTR